MSMGIYTSLSGVLRTLWERLLAGTPDRAIGGEAVVKPESQVFLTHRGHRFYGRFAPNRG